MPTSTTTPVDIDADGGDHTPTAGSAGSRGTEHDAAAGSRTVDGGGGAGNGGAGGGSADEAGAASDDAAARCLAAAAGDPCSTPGESCVFGNICCGDGRLCGTDLKWHYPAVGCACVVPGLDAGSDAGSCGGTSCGVGEICVHPATSAGGAVPLCAARADGGVCAPGQVFTPSCFNLDGAPGGCLPEPVPRPPWCAPIPSSCGTALTCACFPRNVCGPNAADLCIGVSARDLTCLNLAP